MVHMTYHALYNTAAVATMFVNQESTIAALPNTSVNSRPTSEFVDASPVRILVTVTSGLVGPIAPQDVRLVLIDIRTTRPKKV